MPASFSLKVIAGVLPQMEYHFDQPSVCIMGRSAECSIVVPTNPLDSENFVSRFHCLIDITPPHAWIKDLGSSNGTFLNGEKVGQRADSEGTNQSNGAESLEFELKDGDEIQLGEVVLKVEIHVPVLCAQCSNEIPGLQAKNLPPGVSELTCTECNKVVVGEKVYKTLVRRKQTCWKCGIEKKTELMGADQANFLCMSCRLDAHGLAESLLTKSKDDPELFSIRGFQILSELGKGGMGTVFLARNEETQETVALKIMLPNIASQPSAKTAFLREIQNTMALCHPNIVQLKDSGVFEGLYFFTIEYCDMGSIDLLIEFSCGKVKVPMAMQIILQVLDGLEYAHNARIPNLLTEEGKLEEGIGLVHRDIKPTNIFLSSSGNGIVAKIGDFGLAKAFQFAGLSGVTTHGGHQGCLYYCPKTLFFGYRYAKPEVDVWAIAATLYHMLVGSPPRDIPKGENLFKAILTTSPIPILEKDPSIPKKLAQVIDHALFDGTTLSFESAAHFKAALLEAHPVAQ